MASKGTRYKEEQIIRILKEVESGTTVAEMCRKYGGPEQTVYRWHSKYGSRLPADLGLHKMDFLIRRRIDSTSSCSARWELSRG